jgi:tetratricopeptide (TPR) repeat protein
MSNIRAAQQKHSQFFQQTFRDHHRLYRAGGTGSIVALQQFDLDWQNIQIGQKWAASLALADRSAAILCCYYPDAGATILPLRLSPSQRMEWLNAAIAAADFIDNKKSKSNHLGNLGLVYSETGDADHAEKCFNEALVLATENGDPKQQASQLGNLGMLHAQRGQFEQAITHLEKCQKIMVSLDDKQGQANALGNLGLAYDSIGDFEHALNSYDEALQIFTDIDNLYGQGNTLGEIGNVLIKKGAYQDALVFVEKQLSISNQLGDQFGVSMALDNLAIKRYHGLIESAS